MATVSSIGDKSQEIKDKGRGASFLDPSSGDFGHSASQLKAQPRRGKKHGQENAEVEEAEEAEDSREMSWDQAENIMQNCGGAAFALGCHKRRSNPNDKGRLSLADIQQQTPCESEAESHILRSLEARDPMTATERGTGHWSRRVSHHCPNRTQSADAATAATPASAFPNAGVTALDHLALNCAISSGGDDEDEETEDELEVNPSKNQPEQTEDQATSLPRFCDQKRTARKRQQQRHLTQSILEQGKKNLQQGRGLKSSFRYSNKRISNARGGMKGCRRKAFRHETTMTKLKDLTEAINDVQLNADRWDEDGECSDMSQSFGAVDRSRGFSFSNDVAILNRRNVASLKTPNPDGLDPDFDHSDSDATRRRTSVFFFSPLGSSLTSKSTRRRCTMALSMRDESGSNTQCPNSLREKHKLETMEEGGEKDEGSSSNRSNGMNEGGLLGIQQSEIFQELEEHLVEQEKDLMRMIGLFAVSVSLLVGIAAILCCFVGNPLVRGPNAPSFSWCIPFAARQLLMGAWAKILGFLFSESPMFELFCLLLIAFSKSNAC